MPIGDRPFVGPVRRGRTVPKVCVERGKKTMEILLFVRVRKDRFEDLGYLATDEEGRGVVLTREGF